MPSQRPIPVDQALIESPPRYGTPATGGLNVGGAEMPWLDTAAPGQAGIDVAALLHSLRRRWPTALGLGLLLASLVATILWYLLPIKYTAEALIEVGRAEERLSGQSRFESDKAYETFRQTQAEYIKSTLVIDRAVRNEPSIASFRILKGEKNIIAWISEAIKARPLGDSELLQLTLRGESDREVKTVLKEVLEAYQDTVLTTAKARRRQKLDDLNKTTRTRRQDLDELVNEYHDLCSSLGLPTSPEAHDAARDMYTSRLREISDQLSLKRRELSQVQHEFVEAEVLFRSGPAPIPRALVEDRIAKDPEYFELKMQKSEYEDDVERMVQQYGSDAPRVQTYRSEIARIDRKMQKLVRKLTPTIEGVLRAELGNSEGDLKSQLNVLNQQNRRLINEVEALDEQLAKQQQQLENLTGSDSNLKQMIDTIEQQQKILDDLQQKKAFLEVETDQPERVSIRAWPEIREESDLLVKVLEVLGAFGIVFGLTVASVAFADYLSRRVNSPNDLVDHSDLRVLGTLPLIHRSGLISLRSNDPKMLETVLTQSVDSVRAAVLFNRLVGPVRAVMITSAGEQEGRTTLAGQLAVSMARSGRKTLLVDADIMNPQQHDVFQVDGDNGLANLLDGSPTLPTDCLRPTTVENLWLLPAGRLTGGEIQFHGDDASQLFQTLRAEFDMVIIETGPVLTGPEALLIGQHVDAALLSVRRDESRLPRVQAACERLRAVGVTILGAVVHCDGDAPRRASRVLHVARQIPQQPHRKVVDGNRAETTDNEIANDRHAEDESSTDGRISDRPDTASLEPTGFGESAEDVPDEDDRDDTSAFDSQSDQFTSFDSLHDDHHLDRGALDDHNEIEFPIDDDERPDNMT